MVLLGLMLTETGSMPTGISAINAGLDGVPVQVDEVLTQKTDKVPLGVFTANRRVPSAEIRMGLVCAPSKLTKALGGACAAMGPAASAANNTLNTPDLIVLIKPS